jgi:diguanylate cyclase (GGDEF)-like protein/PAS domain S-box-containing protein
MGDAVAFGACARNEAKRDGEDQFRLIADAVPMIIWVVEPSGACTYVNWRWYEYTGQAPGEGEGEGWLRCVHPEDLATAYGDMEAAMARYEPFRIEYRLRRHDGAWRWVLGAGAARFDERTGAFLGYVGSVIDIDERRRAEEQVLELSGRSALALAAGGMGTWDWDIAADRLVWDAQESRLFGLKPGQAPRTGADYLALVHPEDRAELEEAGSQAALTGKGFEGEYRIVRPDGAVRWLAERCATVRDQAGQLVRMIGVTYDVTDRRLAEERVRHLASHDPLTGLPNRSLFQDRLHQALAQARGYEERGALLLLDLDRFKDVNDTLGHEAGDMLLREVARRLQACVRESDTVARLGGDEFAIILPRLPVPIAAATALVSDKIAAALAEPVAYGGALVHTAASIGITLFPDDGEEPGQLLKNADIALYKAKAEGDCCFFEADLRRRVERRKEIEDELRLALSRGEIVPFFQPQVKLSEGRLVGFEALARWCHPERGIILPAEFLSVAEETGLAARLGEMILWQAVVQLQAWRRQRLPVGCMAVNVTGAQLRGGRLAATVREILAETGVPPGQLTIEVTEGVFLGRGADRVADELRALHTLGVAVALDDFGTGYGSLAHLKRFPVDMLKIDQSFVRDMLQDPGDAVIVRAIVGLSHNLGLTVTAEGVETEEQADWLRLQGCDWGQGYLFGRPMPAEEVAGWLDRRRSEDDPNTRPLRGRLGPTQLHRPVE